MRLKARLIFSLLASMLASFSGGWLVTGSKLDILVLQQVVGGDLEGELWDNWVVGMVMLGGAMEPMLHALTCR